MNAPLSTFAAPWSPAATADGAQGRYAFAYFYLGYAYFYIFSLAGDT